MKSEKGVTLCAKKGTPEGLCDVLHVMCASLPLGT